MNYNNKRKGLTLNEYSVSVRPIQTETIFPPFRYTCSKANIILLLFTMSHRNVLVTLYYGNDMLEKCCNMAVSKRLPKGLSKPTEEPMITKYESCGRYSVFT